MVRVRRPRIQPSLVTASCSSMCHGARVDEVRNSSSRVKRHLTGRRALIASSAQIVSVAVSTLPPKPPPTVPPISRSLLNGVSRLSAALSRVKKHAWVSEIDSGVRSPAHR